jgi:hypothetical protein
MGNNVVVDPNEYVVDILRDACSLMEVPIPPSIFPHRPGIFTINFQPGFNTQIIDSLRNLDSASLSDLKYPLIAAVMPIVEKNISMFTGADATFPRIVIAFMTKTSTRSEPVLGKYDPEGVLKTILMPCLREFIKQIAFSTFTIMGDPDMYEYDYSFIPSQQPVGKDLPNDFVDIIEITNLKIPFYSQIKFC